MEQISKEHWAPISTSYDDYDDDDDDYDKTYDNVGCILKERPLWGNS